MLRRWLVRVVVCVGFVGPAAASAEKPPEGEASEHVPSVGAAGRAPESVPRAPGRNANDSLLTGKERELLRAGEIEGGRLVLGGLAATFGGYGIGHALHGRFGERGWIFLIGESAASALGGWYLLGCAYGFEECRRIGLLVGSMITMGVFRGWQIFDIWSGAAAHNRRVRRVRDKAERSYGLYIAPRFESGAFAGTAGVSLRF